MADDALSVALEGIGLTRNTLAPFLNTVKDSAHHPNFDGDIEAIAGGGAPEDVDKFLFYVFGEIWLTGNRELLQANLDHYVQHNILVEDAIENLIDFSDWDRDQYDICESLLLTFCTEVPANRSIESFYSWLQTRENTQWDTLGGDHDEIEQNLKDVFGYFQFLFQQGPREAVLACYQERNDAIELFKPLQNADDERFPLHSGGRHIANAYGNEGSVYLHIVGADDRVIVSKQIPSTVLEPNESTLDFPPSETATNLFLQEYHGHNPMLQEPCPFFVELIGVTKREENYFYYMEGGRELSEFARARFDIAGRKWMKWLNENNRKAFKTVKSEFHQLMTRYFIQILCAVKYMHLLRVVHRDIKIDNVILLSRGGDLEHIPERAKLIDFGISYRFSVGEDTLCADDIGTYQSPECNQCKLNNAPYSGEANDVWALGKMLFELLSGVEAYDELYRAKYDYITSDSYSDAPRPKVTLKKYVKKILKHPTLNCPLLIFFTDSAIDLLERIFVPEDQRITIDEMFTHPWLMDELDIMRENGELGFMDNYFNSLGL